MTIERTAPIHELDRLLDAVATDAAAPPASGWEPTLGRLTALDDAFAPTGDTLRDLRCRLLAEAERAAGRGEGAVARVAPLPFAGRRRAPTTGPGRRLGREIDQAVAAAAVLLVAVGSVWFGRDGDGAVPRRAATVAQVGIAQQPSRAAGTGSASFARSGVDAVDLARASIGGFGSADLVGLIAIGADAERHELADARAQMLREIDASWTGLVEGRGWEAVVGAEQNDARTSEPPLPVGAG